MCGRADDGFGSDSLATLTQLFGALWHAPLQRAEVRPTDPMRFVRRAGPRYEAPYARWGLVPPGLSLDDARRYATFNARVETLEERPLFRDAFRAQRCVIPLAAFWEWPTLPDGTKQKVRIARSDQRPLLVAGLWSVTQTPEGPLESCTIVTRPPTPDLLEVHDRMPALLLSRDLDTWLSGEPRLARGVALTSWPPRILEVVPA